MRAQNAHQLNTNKQTKQNKTNKQNTSKLNLKTQVHANGNKAVIQLQELYVYRISPSLCLTVSVCLSVCLSLSHIHTHTLSLSLHCVNHVHLRSLR